MSVPALYVREGSRFVVYDERQQHTPPIPVPVAIPVELLDEVPEERPNVHRVPVTRCAHGHYCRPGGPGRGCRPCRR